MLCGYSAENAFKWSSRRTYLWNLTLTFVLRDLLYHIWWDRCCSKQRIPFWLYPNIKMKLLWLQEEVPIWFPRPTPRKVRISGVKIPEVDFLYNFFSTNYFPRLPEKQSHVQWRRGPPSEWLGRHLEGVYDHGQETSPGERRKDALKMILSLGKVYPWVTPLKSPGLVISGEGLQPLIPQVNLDLICKVYSCAYIFMHIPLDEKYTKPGIASR